MFLEGDRVLGPEGRGARSRARRPADRARAGAVRRHPGLHGRQGWRHGLGSTRLATSPTSTSRPVKCSGSIEVPEQPKQIVLAADSVWVICDAGNALVRIDPDAYEVTDTVDVGDGPVELEFGIRFPVGPQPAVRTCSDRSRNRRGDRDDRGLRDEPIARPVIRRRAGLGVGLGPGHGGDRSGTNAIAYEIPLPNTRYMDSYWIDGELWVSTAFDQQLLQVNAARP